MEKRMAGDYEIIHAFHIGDKEIVIFIENGIFFCYEIKNITISSEAFLYENSCHGKGVRKIY